MARFNKAKKSINVEAGTVQFDFANGESLAVNMDSLNTEILRQATLHGLSQKIGDAYASAEDADEAYSAAKGVIEGLQSGKWTTRVVGEGGGVTMLTEALAAVSGETVERAAEVIEAMDDAQVEGLKKLPQIKAKLDEIKAKRAAEKAAKSAQQAQAAGALDLANLASALSPTPAQ